MSEVVVRLVGGLGNQIFQYAAGRAVAVRNKSSLAFDLSWFGTDPDRQYALAPFKINARIQDDKTTVKAKPSWVERFAGRIRRNLNLPSQGVPVFSEKSFRYDTAIETITSPVILDGYFQSERYFSAIQSLILEELSVRQEPKTATAEMLDRIRASDAICVHIRRGDYVTNSSANAYHGTCAPDYYDAGLAAVSVGLKNPQCFVFSDDPQWVQTNFKTNLPMTLVDIHGTMEAHEDLRLMRECQHFVIANSSLSWWGAWLGTAQGKRVVAPKVWFRTSANDTSDLIPSGWRKI